MATNHTAKYQLNQWVETDKVLRTDFNEDNTKVDSALATLSGQVAKKAEQTALTALSGRVDKKAEQSALTAQVSKEASDVAALNAALAKRGNCQLTWGTYVGNGDGTKEISLTFPSRPKLVVISGGFMVFFSGQAENGSCLGANNQVLNFRWSGNTVYWKHPNGYPGEQQNAKGRTYFYLALSALG